jgi:hypothetical protein
MTRRRRPRGREYDMEMLAIQMSIARLDHALWPVEPDKWTHGKAFCVPCWETEEVQRQHHEELPY